MGPGTCADPSVRRPVPSAAGEVDTCRARDRGRGLNSFCRHLMRRLTNPAALAASAYTCERWEGCVGWWVSGRRGGGGGGSHRDSAPMAACQGKCGPVFREATTLVDLGWLYALHRLARDRPVGGCASMASGPAGASADWAVGDWKCSGRGGSER